MTYSVAAYAVDVPQLLKQIGSRDDELIELTQLSSRDAIKQHDSNNPGESGGTLRRAIERLINGEFDNMDNDVRNALGYALECLVAGSWPQLDGNDALTSISSGWLHDQPVLKELVGNDPQALSRKMPMPEDFPGICLIPFEELDNRLAAARQAKASNSDPDAKDGYDDLISWLEIARNDGKGLISFYA